MTGTSTNKKLVRITTVPMALRYLLTGQMQFIKNNGFDVVMISADGAELKDVMENEGCRHIIVPMTRTITPFRDLRCLFQLIRTFKKEKPDIVHTHTPKAGLLGMLAARICGVKIRIHTVAGLPMMVEHGFKFGLLKLTERITAASANHVWPNSNSLLQYILKHRLSHPKKLQLIGKGSTNGVDTVFFSRGSLDEQVLHSLKTTISYSPQNKYLLFIGRLVNDKGIVELVNVFNSLVLNHPELKLILVGGYEPALDPLPENTVKEIENNSSIIHINWTDDVKYFMFLADYFIFPSHREGFPNVLLQAGAMLLPVICSRIAGNIDMVTHGETGLIFDCGNELQLKDAVELAIADPAGMQKMAIRLQVQINENYRRENIWQNLLEAYKSLLN